MVAQQIRKLYHATAHSLSGLRFMLQERAFRLELLACVILVPLSFLIAKNATQLLFLLVSLVLVLIVETLNSALEAAIDRTSLEKHPLAKRAKDCASAAVFMALINVALVWLVVGVS